MVSEDLSVRRARIQNANLVAATGPPQDCSRDENQNSDADGNPRDAGTFIGGNDRSLTSIGDGDGGGGLVGQESAFELKGCFPRSVGEFGRQGNENRRAGSGCNGCAPVDGIGSGRQARGATGEHEGSCDIQGPPDDGHFVFKAPVAPKIHRWIEAQAET